jgi:hypothetical protein
MADLPQGAYEYGRADGLTAVVEAMPAMMAAIIVDDYSFADFPDLSSADPDAVGQVLESIFSNILGGGATSMRVLVTYVPPTGNGGDPDEEAS